jgi:hypothetical protein
MATQSGHSVALDEALDAASDAHQMGHHVVARSLAWVRQAYCGLHGHEQYLHFGAKRLSLQCVSCGHESPGWDLNEAPPKTALHGDARQHPVTRPRLVGARRRVA